MLQISEKSVLIHAPLPTVWEAIYDVDCWKIWNPKVYQVELLETPKPGAIGRIHTTRTSAYQFKITRMTNSFLEWEREYEAGTTLRQSYSLTKNAEGSVLTTTLSCEGSFEKIVVGIMRGRLTRDLDKLVGGFQEFCENKWVEEKSLKAKEHIIESRQA